MQPSLIFMQHAASPAMPRPARRGSGAAGRQHSRHYAAFAHGAPDHLPPPPTRRRPSGGRTPDICGRSARPGIRQLRLSRYARLLCELGMSDRKPEFQTRLSEVSWLRTGPPGYIDPTYVVWRAGRYHSWQTSLSWLYFCLRLPVRDPCS